MKFEKIIKEKIEIKIKVEEVVMEEIIGMVILLRRKGKKMNREMGRVWIVLMIEKEI